MPRRGRETSVTGIYHVMLRGINRQDIFEDTEDYLAFIETMRKIQERRADDQESRISTCQIYAYCLMPNHIHLLICEKDWKLCEIVKSLASSYVFYFNKKYGRVGHLFQDRFKSEPCGTPEYFMTLFRYIHQNPVKAGLVKRSEDYEYSSWRNDYLGMGITRVCFVHSAMRRFGMEELSAWVEMPLPEDVSCIDMDERIIVSDEHVREVLLMKSKARSVTEFQLHPMKRKRDIVREVMEELHVGPRQLSRVSGLPYSTIYYMWKLTSSNNSSMG